MKNPIVAKFRTSEKPKPPKVSAEARKLWQQILDDYGISDPGGLLLLRTVCEAFDRMRSAQDLIRTEGMMTRDRFGQSQPHPATRIERDSRAAMTAALKQLNLDLEPLRDKAGRPGGR